ncbi:MAG: hypothetical protein ACTHME_00840 [Candidatus Nitrosocosmicus sp.]
MDISTKDTMNDFDKYEKSIQRYNDFVKRVEQKKTIDHGSFRNKFKEHANQALNDQLDSAGKALENNDTGKAELHAAYAAFYKRMLEL